MESRSYYFRCSSQLCWSDDCTSTHKQDWQWLWRCLDHVNGILQRLSDDCLRPRYGFQYHVGHKVLITYHGLSRNDTDVGRRQRLTSKHITFTFQAVAD